MRYVRSLSIVALAVLLSSGAVAQSQTLSVTNYRVVSEQVLTATYSRITYRADLVNPGPALSHVTATVTTADPFTRVIPGQDTLNFTDVPANGQVTSIDAFSIQAKNSVPFDFGTLQWTFATSGGTTVGPVANAGPNQTAAVGSLVTLNGSGSTNPSGIGTLTYGWTFTSTPSGSAATLSHSDGVTSTFTIDVPGTYVVTLTVSNGLLLSTSSVTVSTSQTPPVANAGPDQTLVVGSTAMLNGSGSTSVDGRALMYSWTLITRPSGSSAALSGANTVAPTFIVDVGGTYVAQLVVNDGLASSPSMITVRTQVARPTANAGPNQTVNTGALVQLNGAGSTDPNGLPLSYQWSLVSLPSGSAASLSDSTAVNPTFSSDRPGTYVAQLIVSNAALSSVPATVTITTQAQIAAPTAYAGANQTVNVGSLVTLSGNGTDPQNLPLTLMWSLISRPALSTAALSSTGIANPVFVADLAGTYVAQLIVNNGVLSSAPSTVSISTTCLQPSADAGSGQSVSVGATVTLSGVSAAGACQGPLTYSWSLNTRPSGSTATLSGASTVSPSFTADVAGIYVAQLIVNNGLTNSNPATVTITASAPIGTGPAIILPSNITVAPNQSVPFPVTLGSPVTGVGLLITLSSSDPSTLTVDPSSVVIWQGSTTPYQTPTVTGIKPGSATITASPFGLSPVSQQVQVTSGGPSTITMSFSPGSLTITGTGSQNLMLSLSMPAPDSGLAVNLISSNPGVATVPGSVGFGPNATSVSVPVNAGSVGSTTITASATGVSSATAGVTVTSIQAPPAAISLPANLSLGNGQSLGYPVNLTTPAPAGGVTVILTSSDTSKVTVTPNVFIAGGATYAASQAVVSGNSIGSATISASASGFNPGTGLVEVMTNGFNTYFSPGSLDISTGTTLNVSLNLSNPSPVTLTATLTSSSPGVATVPATVTIPANTTVVYVPINGIAPGSATITAAVPNYGLSTANVTVDPTGAVTATWYGACWYTGTILGITGDFQAIDFSIAAPAPVTLQGTLFFAPNCDASNGTDNMNDFGTLTSPGHMVQGFSHHPDEVPTSAMYWIGPLTPDRKCAPGSPCSGCLNYTKATPNCNLLP
jgi:hypothetical protein